MKKSITLIVITTIILVLVTSCAPKVEKTVANTNFATNPNDKTSKRKNK